MNKDHWYLSTILKLRVMEIPKQCRPFMPRTIQETLRPLLTSMKLLGLYHDISDNKNTVNPLLALNVPKPRPWKKIFNSGTYSLVVVLLLWFNFIRFCAGLFPRDAGFTTRVFVLVWYGQCATNATIMYFACHKLCNLPAFMKHWNTLFDDTLTTKRKCREKDSKKYVAAAAAIAWILSIFNTVGVLYLLNGKLKEANGFRMSTIRPFPESTATIVACSVLHVIETAAWIFPAIFVITLSYTVKLNFDSFAETFEKHIDETENGIPAELHCFRSRHVKLCKAVAILDRVFKYLMSVCFGSNILLCCFILYDLVNNGSAMDPLSLTMDVFWLISCICAMLATAISSSQVNDAAHSALDPLFSIQTFGATAAEIGQLNLFVAKLTGTTVGFTVLNMIVITKEVILTLAGVFITYFFLLFQFKIN